MEITGQEIHDKFFEKYFKELEPYNHIYRNIVPLTNNLMVTVNPTNSSFQRQASRIKYEDFIRKFEHLSEFEKKRFRIVLTKILLKSGITNPKDYFETDLDYFKFVTITLLDKKDVLEGVGFPYIFKILNPMYMENYETILAQEKINKN